MAHVCVSNGSEDVSVARISNGTGVWLWLAAARGRVPRGFNLSSHKVCKHWVLGDIVIYIRYDINSE